MGSEFLDQDERILIFRLAAAQIEIGRLFIRVLEGRYLDRADPDKGRFRAFILTSLKFFLADEGERSRAQKRGGGNVLSLEISSGEERYQREPAHDETVHDSVEH